MAGGAAVRVPSAPAPAPIIIAPAPCIGGSLLLAMAPMGLVSPSASCGHDYEASKDGR